MSPKFKKWLAGFGVAAWGGAFAPLSVAYVLPTSIHFDRLSLKAMLQVAAAGAVSHIILYCVKSPIPALCETETSSETK